MEKDKRIFVAGGGGMIGRAILRRLRADGFAAILDDTAAGLDLTDQRAVAAFFAAEKPDYVFLNSIKVGGILANSRHPAEFIYANIASQTNVIHAAREAGVKKLLFMGSSCIYPKDCPQPIKEEYLLTGQLEPTSEAYATAKIAGIRMCQAYHRQYGVAFIAAVPADAYGPDDDFNPETGHVLPALVSKMHHAVITGAPEVVVWGTGAPRREALHVADLADACLFLMDNYGKPDLVNIGGGRDISIGEMAQVVGEVVGFRGKITFDTSKPDGMPRKLLDTGKLEMLGWRPKISLTEGVEHTYHWYKNHIAQKPSEDGQ